MITVRDEGPDDIASIHAVIVGAFGQSEEADLVERLRHGSAATTSLVAVHVDAIVGHILFSPVTIDGTPSVRALSLPPLAVAPTHQRRGVGAVLVEAGLARCRRLDVGIVVVLGHPHYYPRFGFQPAHQLGLTCEYDVPPEIFMTLDLTPGSLDSMSGVARYHAAFGQL